MYVECSHSYTEGDVEVKKITFIVAALFLTVLFPAAVFLFSAGCIFYFIKKNPDKKMRNYAIGLLVASTLFLGDKPTDPETVAEETNSARVSEVVESTPVEDLESKAPAEAKEAAAKAKEAEEEERKKQEIAESKAKEEAAKQKEEAESKAQAESAAAEEKLATERDTIHQATPPVTNGYTYVEINNNVPLFTNADLSSTEAWEDYGALDHLGRVTEANAVLGVELMPAEERGSISSIRPTGWNQENYSVVPGGWLYNRSHLIGFQLTGENANARNLITGTRWFNAEGMIPFENFIANYIETTENHVRYRVTPYFEGDNLLASGIYMEGMSIEDNGEALMFHIYVPNIQPSVHLDYATGLSWTDEPEPEPEVVEEVPVVETVVEEAPVETEINDVTTVDTNGNGQVTIQEAKDAGFSMPIYSDHWLYPYMIDRDGDGMVGE